MHVCVGSLQKSVIPYKLSMGKLVGISRWQSVEDQNGDPVFSGHTYTAYVSVDNVKKSQYLYILSMGSLLAIG